VETKPILSFYTNMPTPYQLDFFEALKELFELRVIYFTTRESDRQWDLSLSGNGYSIQVLKNNLLAKLMQKKVTSFHFSNQIFRILENDKADFVIVNGTYWSPNVVFALRYSYKRKRKVAFWSEPVFPVSNRLLFNLKKMMLGPVFRYSHLLLAIGKQAAESYRQYGYSKPVFNIPYNINSNLFARQNLDPSLFREMVTKFKPGKEIVLLSSGSLIHRKGMDILVRAFMQLPDHLNAHLLLMGDGESKKELQQLSANSNRIHFIGFQEKNMVPYWFNLADIFVFASRYDGWGLVINEALAAQKPVICSNTVGAAKDKLVNLHNAIIIDDEDVKKWSLAMDQLITSEAFRNKIIENSQVVKQELSSDFNAKKVYDIYRAIE
jgi:glycosyltransferase involved in cell wall biosynthesis